jgi:hypothetical protein
MKSVTLTKIGVVVLVGMSMALGLEAQEPGGPVASLTQVQGTVLVNLGKDYVNARPGTPLSPGARVLTMDKSSATVAYKGACVKQLKENGLLVVRGPADCQTAGAGQAAGPVYAAAIGATAIGSDASANKDNDCKVKEGERLEGEERERCCLCCEKERGDKRERCCDIEGEEGCCKKQEGEERDSCCAGCVIVWWKSGHFWAGSALFTGGAIYIYNSDRNDRGVSAE